MTLTKAQSAELWKEFDRQIKEKGHGKTEESQDWLENMAENLYMTDDIESFTPEELGDVLQQGSHDYRYDDKFDEYYYGIDNDWEREQYRKGALETMPMVEREMIKDLGVKNKK